MYSSLDCLYWDVSHWSQCSVRSLRPIYYIWCSPRGPPSSRWLLHLDDDDPCLPLRANEASIPASSIRVRVRAAHSSLATTELLSRCSLGAKGDLVPGWSRSNPSMFGLEREANIFGYKYNKHKCLKHYFGCKRQYTNLRTGHIKHFVQIYCPTNINSIFYVNIDWGWIKMIMYAELMVWWSVYHCTRHSRQRWQLSRSALTSAGSVFQAITSQHPFHLSWFFCLFLLIHQLFNINNWENLFWITWYDLNVASGDQAVPAPSPEVAVIPGIVQTTGECH